MKYERVHLNGRLSKLGLNPYKEPPPNEEGRLNTYSSKSVSKIRAITHAINWLVNNDKNTYMSMITLSYNDDWHEWKRFEHRKKFIKNFGMWMRRNSGEKPYYMYVSEKTAKRKTHFHIIFIHKYIQELDKYLMNLNSRNPTLSVNLKYNRKAWYITKYMQKGLSYDQKSIMTSDEYKGILKLKMKSKYRLWYHNLPFKMSKDIEIDSNKYPVKIISKERREFIENQTIDFQGCIGHYKTWNEEIPYLQNGEQYNILKK